jgi:hypothetical protein
MVTSRDSLSSALASEQDPEVREMLARRLDELK